MDYHFIIVVNFGQYRIGWDGIHAVQPGETRMQAYAAILARTRERAASKGIPVAHEMPTFFSLEPNQFGA